MKWNEVLSCLSGKAPEQIADITEEQLNKYAKTSRSPLGNLYGKIQGQTDYTVLLDAHIDTIGMVVVGIDPNGFVLVDKYGGVDLRTLAGSEVTVWGKRQLFGVFSILPPHLKQSDQKTVPDITKMAIDIGCTKEQAEALICPGDRVTFRHRDAALAQGCYSGTGLDNRAGVAILLRVCELLHQAEQPLPVNVVVQFSQMEEAGTGFAGAATGANAWQPDEAIVVDAGFAAYPGSGYPTPGKLGHGPMIGLSPLLSHSISKQLQTVAKDADIAYTLDVFGGRSGTNADRILTAGAGVPTGLLSYPLQNMHMPKEIVQPNDLEYAAQLLFAYLMRGGLSHV